MSDASTIRSFIAVELPPDIHTWCEETMDRARQKLGPTTQALRWVRPEGIHLTLKFLGAVSADQLATIREEVASQLVGQAPFSLAIGHIGVFPRPRAPRVVWLAALGDVAALTATQQRVESATVLLGFPPENRPFQPHLTLARVRPEATPEQLAAIGGLAANWPTTTSPPFDVTSLSLMQSHLGPGGARYTRLAEIPLGG